MREIKFRAWDKEYEEMLHDISLDSDTWDMMNEFFKHVDLEWLQYTGLKDKNEREIFDGDIIRFTERTVNGGEFTHICMVFQHENGTWRVEGRSDFDKVHIARRDLYSVRHFCEVIGNKYENPELLK